MSPPALQLTGLCAGYDGVAVVHDVDLVVRSGEVVALLGANGAGKTTTLLTVSGLVPKLGGTIEVPTLFGKGSLKIPAGTQSATTFRLRDKGMPSLRGGRQGDQLVRVQVEVPTSLKAEQRKLLEEFAKISGDAHEPTSKSFFEKAKKFF